MASLPGGICYLPRWTAIDDNGAILPGAKLYSYASGGTFSTPLALYADADLAVALSNPVVADSGGRFVTMRFLPEGYDLILTDADDNEIWRSLDCIDVGQTFLANLGLQLGTGTFDVNSGYVIIPGDWYVTSDAGDATNPFIFQLPPLDGWTTPLTLAHFAPLPAEVTPDGTDTINFVAAPRDLPAASGSGVGTMTLYPGTSTWLVQNYSLVP